MKKFVAGLLIACLAFTTGCFNVNLVPKNQQQQQQQNNQIEGADWRTWGTISKSGTLRLGETSADVCAVMNESQIDLYFDEPTQRIFDSLLFPRLLTEQEMKDSVIMFDDSEDSGFTDVTLLVDDGMGKTFSWTWICDSKNKTYELSPKAVNDEIDSKKEGTIPDVFLDTWVQTLGSGLYFYKLDKNGSWYAWNELGTYNESGGMRYDGDYIYLITQDTDELVEMFYCYSEDMLVDHDGGILKREVLSDESTEGPEDYGNPNSANPVKFEGDSHKPLTDVEGEWEYNGYGSKPKLNAGYFIFYQDKRFVHCIDNGDVIEEGEYETPKGDKSLSTMTMYFKDGHTETMEITFDEGYVMKDWNGYYLFRRNGDAGGSTEPADAEAGAAE